MVQVRVSSACWGMSRSSPSPTAGACLVCRSGSIEGMVTVNFATRDDTATSPDDYVAVSGVVTWGDGEAGCKTIPITVKVGRSARNRSNQYGSSSRIRSAQGSPWTRRASISPTSRPPGACARADARRRLEPGRRRRRRFRPVDDVGGACLPPTLRATSCRPMRPAHALARTLFAPCGFSRPGGNPLRRGGSGVRSGRSWRARVCLSKRDRTCRTERPGLAAVGLGPS